MKRIISEVSYGDEPWDQELTLCDGERHYSCTRSVVSDPVEIGPCNCNEKDRQAS